MPEMTDLYGLPVTGADNAALQGIEDFVHGFISFQTKATNVLKAAEAAPDCALINAYAAILYMLLEAPVAPKLAAPFLKAAEAAAPNATPREQATVNAARLFHDGRIPELIALCEETIRRYPRDMVMLKLGQYHTFNTGDFPAMLRIATRAFPGADDIAYAHGMLAFGYEECHLLDQAEAAARRAMQLRHDEPWAHHALAHIYLTRGDVTGGIVFLESVADTWRDLNSFMHSHNWWHLALFYISQGRHADVLQAYDEHVWGLAKDYSQDQVGAVSLLARLDFAGIDVGDRWADVVAHVAQRGADTVSPFLTLQYLYGLGRTDDRAAMNVLMQAITDRAADSTLHDYRAWAEVALPAAQGIVAHANRDWAEAARLMGIALPRLAECGGSHAQRDLFDQIHLDALMENGDVARAQQVLEMRRTYDPDGVPLNRMLAEVYARNGLPELAAQAQGRATR
ncbi:tetratricopeptide repeat protein [Pseudosulfitobacter sp. DSM 107133]|uniref:tetratricopeptide repeat protein n=1 Tax=Pseudosulfitobacter sp. DSM 107133 TaxID=2883100 RepID=UPI001F07B6B5|nr:tetratricopeptide repeat protein [Pseudosulfitobacter sp. DSM 107133]UOA25430.1 hypothetical protein DSM107133_00102 [Pseudosulfitobacter sp. DSM 107133]